MYENIFKHCMKMSTPLPAVGITFIFIILIGEKWYVIILKCISLVLV